VGGRTSCSKDWEKKGDWSKEEIFLWVSNCRGTPKTQGEESPRKRAMGFRIEARK